MQIGEEPLLYLPVYHGQFFPNHLTMENHKEFFKNLDLELADDDGFISEENESTILQMKKWFYYNQKMLNWCLKETENQDRPKQDHQTFMIEFEKEPLFNDLLKFFNKLINSFFDYKLYPAEIGTFVIQKPEESNDWHRHVFSGKDLPVEYVCVYYLRGSEKHGALHLTVNLDVHSMQKKYAMNTGEFIIFPSFPHYVTKNNTDEDRVVVAINYSKFDRESVQKLDDIPEETWKNDLKKICCW